MVDRPPAMYANGRPVVEEFAPEEYLYRRVSAKEWYAREAQSPLLDGVKRSWASDIPFTPPMSLNRSMFSEPHHVLYPPDPITSADEKGDALNDIGEARRYFEAYGVMGIKAKDWPEGPESVDGKTFEWTLKHVPESFNYSHSELWTGINGVFAPSNQPSKRTRAAYRQVMANLSEPFYAPGDAAGLYGT